MIKKLFIFSGLCLLSIVSYSQEEKKNIVRTATDLKTGNTQDVLTNFMQIGYEDLQEGGRFQFASSLIGFRARIQPKLLVDTNYLKNTLSRNLNFNIDLRINDQNQLSDGTVGFKYAIINKRDKTIFNAAKDFYGGKKVQEINKESLKIQAKVDDEFLNLEWRNQNAITLSEEEIKSVRAYFDNNSKIRIEDLPKIFQDYLQNILDNNSFFKGTPVSNYQSFRRTMYDQLASQHSRKPLLTIGALYTFDPQLSIQAQYIQGMTPVGAGMALEVNAQAILNIIDTVVNSSNLQRQVFNASAGLNWILTQNAAGQSLIELKVQGEYLNVLQGLLAGEESESFALSGTLRFRVTPANIWFPINFKYDPVTNKIRTNFALKVNF